MFQVSKYRKTSQNYWEFMLKKKDTKKPFWKRLIKSTEKVNFQFFGFNFYLFLQCPWITVDWNHFNAEGKSK